MSNTRILDHDWPADLDPETVPFATRTKTVLRRHGLYGDPRRFNTLTVAEVAGWTNTGLVTIANIRTTAHAAICRHHAETDLRARIAVDLEAMASERWTPHVWHRDPRFTAFIPKCNSTVYEIATTRSAVDRRFLWNRLDGLFAAVEVQAALGLSDAVAQYVELITGQRGVRLGVLLARTGLDGGDPITRSEAARQLGVSYQRIYQLERKLSKHRNRTAPPAGVWTPQAARAQQTRWPDVYTAAGAAAITRFVSPQ